MKYIFIKLLLILCMCVSKNTYSQFCKKATVYTKCPSLSCPYLSPRLLKNIQNRPMKITNVKIDRVTYQKITFDVKDTLFFVTDSILHLFSEAGYPSIELVKLEMEGAKVIDLTQQILITPSKK